MRRTAVCLVLFAAFFIFVFTCHAQKSQWQDEFDRKIKGKRQFADVVKDVYFDTVIIDEPDGLVVLRFDYPKRGTYLYFAWSRGERKTLDILGKGLFYENNDYNDKVYAREARKTKVSKRPIFLIECAPPSPVIKSVRIENDSPIEPFHTQGDLWLNTWADDDNVYSGWGDGMGVIMTRFTDCGIIRFKGSPPDIRGEEMCPDAPTAVPNVNDKPSSLLFIDGRLYGHFHSPLGDAKIGYLAYSDDYGKTWERMGFWEKSKEREKDSSPWVRKGRTISSNFRCGFFINMGKNYNLNKDGYVYMLGIGTEWAWRGGVYLARVSKKKVIDYRSYEYFMGMEGDVPQWSATETMAVPLRGVRTPSMGSAVYHPGIKRYLFLTELELWDAPNPWGPWTYAGHWRKNTSEEWNSGYMPGIISKDMGPNDFWFTISGALDMPENDFKGPGLRYKLHLGKMIMEIKKDSR